MNPSQLEALDLGGHVAVTAAAGSGKTTVLVERCLRILEANDFHPEQIVALTFTEEAALQMRRKLLAAVRKRTGPAAENRWNLVASRLSLAQVTTIHGFCASLLLEHAEHLPEIAGFRIASPGEQEFLIRRCVGDSLRDLSNQGSVDLRTLLEYLTVEGIRSTLLDLIRHRCHLGRLETGAAGVEKLRSIYRQETAGVLVRSREVEALRRTLALIPTYLTGGDDSCAERCRRQLALFARRRGLTPVELAENLRETLRGSVRAGRRWRGSPHYCSLLDAWEQVRLTFRRRPLDLPAAPEGADRHYRKAVVALRRIYQRTLANYRSAKTRAGVLDFDDLLERAAELTRRPAIRRSLRERYPYILVDEFQDTNRLQWQLLRPLIGPSGNLMVVGDAKQSIYRFRDADVSIFGDVQSWVGRRGKVVCMPENYRSAPPLVGFVNRVFRRLFQPLFDYEADHQEMQPMRTSAELQPGRAVQICRLGDSDPDEAAVAAAWVRKLLEEEQVKPAQVALLLRTRTRLQRYQAAFRQAGIPFRSVGGGGFFQRQEVMDMICLLRWLVDPRDCVALIGVLRSPFFSFSDEDLFRIAQLPGNLFHEKLNAAAQLGTAGQAHWQDAAELLGVARAALEERPWPQVLAWFLEVGGYWSVASTGAEAARVIANLEKFLDLTRDFGRQGGGSLRGFLRQLETLAVRDSGEPEAAPITDGADVVSIYTIHGAKGLQFPVVLLPDLGAPFSHTPSDRFCTHTAQTGGETVSYFGIRIRNPDRGYRDLTHPIHQAVRRLNEYRELAEERRLLYVAMTRAEDRLLLLGRGGDRPSYLQWLLDCGVEDYLTSAEWMSPACPASGRLPSPSAPTEPPIHVAARRPVECPARPVYWTPTEIVQQRRCPRRFYLASIEGRSEDGPWATEPDRAARLGSAIHELIDRVGLKAQPDRLRRDAEALASRLQPSLGGPMPQLADLLESHAHTFQRSRLAVDMAAARRVYSERAFTLKLPVERRGGEAGNAYLRGIVDNLYQRQEGDWVVVDFKTNARPTKGMPGLDDFRRQVELYLWATSRLLSTEGVSGVLFFTGDGREVPVPWGPEAEAGCRSLLDRLPATRARADYPRTADASICETCGFKTSGVCPGASGAEVSVPNSV